ncbi:MAG: NAD(P)-binding domain-containing protein, partial [Anaerolineales bacterium]|nr:NAD(P)-binding domain-containing protein [Anaerolineales bacterium]
MNDNMKYTVIGAGNGGKAMSAHMALMGKEVTLYNRTYAHIEVIAQRGGVDLDNPDGLSGFGKLAKVTDQIQEAVEGADVIMVVVPSSGHRDVAAAAAPYLRDGQIVLLHPGRTCGAIEF